MYASTKDFFKSYLEGLAVELQVGPAILSTQAGFSHDFLFTRRGLTTSTGVPARGW